MATFKLYNKQSTSSEKLYLMIFFVTYWSQESIIYYIVCLFQIYCIAMMEDYGFAKIRGFSFWPAKKSGVSAGKLWVRFYGSHQFGVISNVEKNWIKLNEASLKKFSKPQFLNHSAISKALREMVDVVKDIDDSDLGIQNVLAGLNLTSLKPVCHVSVYHHKDQAENVNSVNMQDNTVNSEQVQSVRTKEILRTGTELPLSETQNKDIDRKNALSKYKTSKAKTSKAKTSTPHGKNQNPKHDNSEVKSKQAKVKKTLLQNQHEVEKKFDEKITSKNGGFYCKCGFVSALKLKATTHAMNCGIKRKKSFRRKVIKCSECVATFNLRSLLHKHYKKTHQTAMYVCSSCFKSYTQRRTYMTHLKVHDADYTNKFQCEKCSFSGSRNNWDLQRHIERNHRAPIKDICSIIVNEIIVSAFESANTKELSWADEDFVPPVIDFHSDVVNGLIDSVDDNVFVTEISKEHEVNVFTGSLNTVVMSEPALNTDSESLNERDVSEADLAAAIDVAHVDVAHFDVAHFELVPKVVSLYEQIRIDNIREREALIAESRILEQIAADKLELCSKHNKKVLNKIGIKMPQNQPNKQQVVPTRRSERVKKCSNNLEECLLAPIEIKIEIKIEDVTDQENEVENCSRGMLTNKSDIQNDNTETEKMARDILEEVLIASMCREAKTKGQFKCNDCSYLARDNYNLKKHKMRVHSPVSYQCLICDQVFESKFSFSCHNSNCYFVCPFIGCSKTFKTNSKLQAHQRMHLSMLRRLSL